MVNRYVRSWQGSVNKGELSGYRVEIRLQRLPWPLFIVAFTEPTRPHEPMIGFASGRRQLAEHLETLRVEVTWEDGRGPLAPERDRPGYRVPSRDRSRPNALETALSSRAG